MINGSMVSQAFRAKTAPPWNEHATWPERQAAVSFQNLGPHLIDATDLG